MRREHFRMKMMSRRRGTMRKTREGKKKRRGHFCGKCPVSSL